VAVATTADLDRRVRRALTFIDTAVAHLRSFAFANPDPSIESALQWLEDAKNELQSILDGAVKNTVILIDNNVALRVTRKAGVKNAIEILVGKCINEYLSSENG
jgi:hypothetical protein